MSNHIDDDPNIYVLGKVRVYMHPDFFAKVASPEFKKTLAAWVKEHRDDPRQKRLHRSLPYGERQQ